MKDRAPIPLLPHVFINTKGEDLLAALRGGTVSTNVFLCRLRNH
jgi:hypothetical protein